MLRHLQTQDYQMVLKRRSGAAPLLFVTCKLSACPISVSRGFVTEQSIYALVLRCGISKISDYVVYLYIHVEGNWSSPLSPIRMRER
ncbi:hypothetical protein GDO78_004429 [Eleutherodactylus coqui]|uniref:Uncharacterized protein n=1 Tax=Eleutherodactylus coqui TaxID=57060 RepID=A0A8J6ESP5_ELECQ|nr:hypothetical protein GDO78_004429 [Eleutherodactylus coqui]